ncbi:hypothetical protein Celaphus_00012336 [Cervus elaphus hippelaphus]|uniref:Uncharacterized protein n=1 Tax=Cervus elaphus hippelaphus TaxID=46360 RepID=A0A212CK89_CEREH|nr:hypothetical protein Celaphus_00012336 [Cervus elaphus hippelaphus]
MSHRTSGTAVFRKGSQAPQNVAVAPSNGTDLAKTSNQGKEAQNPSSQRSKALSKETQTALPLLPWAAAPSAVWLFVSWQQALWMLESPKPQDT